MDHPRRNKVTEPIVLSKATCEILAQIVVQQPIGQAVLNVAQGEHGLEPGSEMTLMIEASLVPRAKVTTEV